MEKAEFKTKIEKEDIDVILPPTLCAPNEEARIVGGSIKWSISPQLRQYGIWSFQQTVDAIEVEVEIYKEEDSVADRTQTLTIDCYWETEFVIENYSSPNDFTVSKLEINFIKKHIKAII